MKNIYSFIFAGLLLFCVTACSDEKLYDGEEVNTEAPGFSGDGEPIDIFVENMELRTRNVNFDEEAPVRINSYWLGVFDYGNGNLVSSYHNELGYAFVSSGIVSSGLIRQKFPDPTGDTTNKGFFVVGIVNYNGVRGSWSSNPGVLEDLSSMLDKVKTWADFNSIGIDTYSAYYDGSDHSNDAPMMAGFMNKNNYDNSDPSKSHIKINQFEQTPKKPVLKMNGDINNLFVPYTGGKFQTTGYTLNLRRLVSNFNFNIEAGENISIERISYRKHNVPAAVYIIERTMFKVDENNKDIIESFPTEAAYSPNFGDLEAATGYTSDDKDVDIDIHQSEDGKWSFSYQHFANKHWAKTVPGKYADREAYFTDQQGNKVFTALAESATDINNNATYIELKMRVLDKVRNRCAEVIYLIHEGYTSDTDGSEINWMNEITAEQEKALLSDFSCARNMNYTYNIKVHGIDNLSVNVGDNDYVDENLKLVHRPDISGKIWTITYIGETLNDKGTSDFGFISQDDGFKKYLTGKDDSGEYETTTTTETENTQEGGTPSIQDEVAQVRKYSNVIHINGDNPDLAFRIYGYNSARGVIEGFNYNFEQSSFENLRGMWPESAGGTSHYFQDFNSMLEDYLIGRDPEQLKEVIKMVGVYENGEYTDLTNVDDKTLLEDKLEELVEFLAWEDIRNKKKKTSAIETLLFETFKLKAYGENAPNFSELKGPNGEEIKQKIRITEQHDTGANQSQNVTSQKYWDIEIPIKVNMNEPMNIVQFMLAAEYLLGPNNKTGKTLPQDYDLLIRARRQNVVNAANGDNYKYVRCFYLGDRHGSQDEEDDCTHGIEIYAAIQGVE